MKKDLKKHIPENVMWTIEQLRHAGFEAFVVGGCVRDVLLGRNPNDWDITTNATPDQIMTVFEKTDRRVVYENNFGTVGIINKDLDHNDVSYEIEITPYRTESGYSDARHPDNVSFAQTISEDLSRRDFTINAMAYDPIDNMLIDEYGGHDDLKNKIIRTVGNPHERFSEDALRIMRAVRFSAQLGFMCEEETLSAVRSLKDSLEKISAERIRDEFLKLIDAPFAVDGILMMQKMGLMNLVVPELEEGIGCDQGGAHSYDVWVHLVKSFGHAVEKEYPLYVKLAALFHDIGKPRTRRPSNGRGSKEWTFYGHEVVGANMVRDIAQRLKLPKEFSEKVVKLVRYHMFFSDPDAITLSAVRRMVRNVGQDMIWDLMNLRICDRIGTGRPKEQPYRFRKYQAMIEEVLRDPISVGMLKLNGDIMIHEMGMKPGKRMGWMLHALLEEVLDDPKKNTRDYLESRVRVFNELSDHELEQMGQSGKDKRDDVEFSEVKKLHRKHKVD